MGLIQTADQLKFSYHAIAEGARESGLLSDSFFNGEQARTTTGRKKEDQAYEIVQAAPNL